VLKDTINIILDNLKEIDKDYIYLFGSTSKGTATENSDIDIAFYSQTDYDPFEIFIQAQNLGKKLKKEVDLIQLKHSSTVFQKEVVEHGKVIYEKDPIEREKFEILVFKKYARLNEERKLIIENYGADL
jgi:predicted nucleotidyltransferase